MDANDSLQRIAMMHRLADLKRLAERAKTGTDLERQMAASILVELAARDWRDVLPGLIDSAPEASA